MRFRDKTVVVTGGSTGIGFASAKRFAAEGAHVYITGRRQLELDAAVAAIGASATAVRADLGSLAEIEKLFAIVRRTHPAIHALFANAGGGALGPIGAITPAQYVQTFDTNVRGTLFTVQYALPLLVDGGAIVLNASTAATKGTAGFSLYSASKAAIRNFARSWALDLAPRRIRVNAI